MVLSAPKRALSHAGNASCIQGRKNSFSGTVDSERKIFCWNVSFLVFNYCEKCSNTILFYYNEYHSFHAHHIIAVVSVEIFQNASHTLSLSNLHVCCYLQHDLSMLLKRGIFSQNQKKFFGIFFLWSDTFPPLLALLHMFRND